MKILVTGAKGMLGQDLCPALEDAGYSVAETGRDELDITDFGAVEKILNAEKPDIVVHCAAYTNVDGAETDLATATAINVTGSENVAKACAKNDAAMVYISTDYVFDGTKTEPYTPDDAPNPLNNYGLTKLQGEEAVKKHLEKYYIVRTSWLYGHHGKNFVETMLSLKGKEINGLGLSAFGRSNVRPHMGALGSAAAPAEIRVVNDQFGCPTWTVDLANGIVELLEEGDYGTYHVCGGGETTWYEFAREIGVDVQPCTTEEFPRPAKRPKYSVMDSDCRNWKAALKDYLALRED
jgi:dTDP-4-dehydrorhamnose reductase